ncbi:MAG: sigma-54-dependent transcriptional regulator [Candidatus Brocadiia bacterium]
MADDASGRVLVVDDLQGVRQILASVLKKAGYQVEEAGDGSAALEAVRAHPPDAMLLDIRMPGLDGFEVLRRVQELDPELPVVMITAYEDVDTAVQAMHAGAYHYLSKPFHNAEVLAVVERAIERRRLAHTVRSLQERADHLGPVGELLGTSDAIARLLEQLDRAARTDGPVLITGEEGTGKQLVARAIHARSPRRRGPFVALDCGAVPAELLDSDLFGHERHAFPGADRRRPGQLELAAGGTLYLADVPALPLGAQGRLAQFLKEGHVRRLGGSQPMALDVRLVAGTAVDLRELVAGSLFRRDLYERLAETPLAIPPLRRRPDDVVYLVKRFLDATNRELGKNVQGPTREALDLLVAHPWPGNLRELRHALKRAVLLADTRIEPRHLAIEPHTQEAPRPPAAQQAGHEPDLPLAERTRKAVERVERQAIADALRRTGGNKSAAARLLDINYKTLHVKMKKYDLQLPQERDG